MDELRRVSSMPGIRGVCLHSWPNGKGVPEPEQDEKFWRLAVELDVPLAAHMSFGGGRVAYVADLTAQGKMVGGNFAPIVAMLTKGGNGFVATQLITSGVFDRIPELQFFFAETQVGWVPYYGEDADENYKRHRYWSGLDMPHLPSWYLRRREIGIDKLQWSTDFPHVQCDWPNSRQVIEEQFQGVPEDEKRQIVCDNAVRYFHLDRE
jgi:predicted TIM-barrel fold metal-dependent hydrolase